MIDSTLLLVSSYGLPFLALITALSCLALPVPVSIVMMLSGSFVASGDFELWQVFLAAYVAALTGDQLGYWIGRGGGNLLLGWMEKSPARAALIGKAHGMLEEKGWIAIFLTRWLFSPLGPYVNFIGGAAAMNWLKFTLPGAAGELVWVTLYVGLGYFFSANISAVSDLVSSASGFLAAGAVVAFLGWRLWRSLGNSSGDATKSM